MTLKNPTNAELNAAFAREICGHKQDNPHLKNETSPIGWIVDGKYVSKIPDYCSDANAVLPYLDKCNTWSSWNERNSAVVGVSVLMEGRQGWFMSGNQTSFAKAAVICLLRAHGVEVIEDEIN